jgi:rare lipoprotein A
MKIVLLFSLALAGYVSYRFLQPPFGDSREQFALDQPLNATVQVTGSMYPITFRAGMSVRETLIQAGFQFAASDLVYPDADSSVFAGMIIHWYPARTLRVMVDGGEKTVSVVSPTSETIIAEVGIPLRDDDIVAPARGVTIPDGGKIVITRVEIREETKETKISFATKIEEDAELSWRKKIVKQKGENGVRTTNYRVSYHNGKEVNRKTLSTEVTKDPVTEVITQGTYVKTGKSHRGAASWYAWTGTMAGANPWLPKGSYVRVTNMDNGKSVIVVINDRGPFVPGRIIDLDKVAFAKIAPTGAGVINVKMEEIVN